MEPEFPLISVIIPIYNVEDYLEQCINSVCTQSYENLQIIIVDDGSTDNSLSVCKKYQERDRRVEVLHKENGGQTSARKAGLRTAAGEYVSFVDGDDWIDRDTFEKIIPYLSEPVRADIVAYGCIEEYPEYKNYRYNTVGEGLYTEKKLENLKRSILMDDNFFESNMLPHLCDKVIKKELMTECLGRVPNEITFGEDAVSTFLCMIKAKSIYVWSMAPYHYRQREGSMVREQKELPLCNFQSIYRTMINAIDQYEELEQQIKLYLFFTLCLKAYSRIGSRMPLFPFEKVRQGGRVFIYGAGGFGKVVADYVKHKSELKLAGWTDKKADYYRKQGLEVLPPETMFTEQYDIIVIAILNEKVAYQIKGELLLQGIPEEKIDYVKKDLMKEQKLPVWIYDGTEGP